MKTTIHDLYRSPLCLWVEDPLTHEVLTALWADVQISILVADGKQGVAHMLRGLPKRVQGKVFGLVDRDFDDDNHQQWSQQSCQVLRLPAHEFENLLLDCQVLSELSGAESASDIEARAKRHAEALLYFMVCKGVLREMQRALGSGFPVDPPQSLPDLQAVADHIRNSPYWATHHSAWGQWNSEPARRAALEREEARLRSDLDTGTWLRSFSGKEIFHRLRAEVPQLDKTPVRPPSPSSADRDLDLAKRIATKMRESDRIPPVLTELRQVLRSKAAL